MNPLPPASTIHGRYQIVRQIGQGGFGAVYEAIDQRLNNRVALKQLLLAGDDINRAFRREAEILASLRHAALPKVFDYFTDEHGQFLVMEYIEGDELATLVRQRSAPFPLDTVFGWADQLLGALTYLHTRTPPILHRDIKPQNLKVVPPNEIVLLDFGLAKGTPTAGATLSHSLRAYTPGYAPLEQMHGQATTPQSDLYALAATLYYLLTRSVPPESTARASDALRRLPDPLRPLHEVNPSVPRAVSDVLMGALALHAEDRPASAAAMRGALEEAYKAVVVPPPSEQTVVDGPVPHDATVVDAPTPPVDTGGISPSVRWAALAGAVLVIVIVVALVWQPLMGRGDPGVVAGETAAPPMQTVAATLTAAPDQPTAASTATEAPAATEAPTATAQAAGIAIPTVTPALTTVVDPAATEAPPPVVERIVFSSGRNGSGEIFVMDADGGNQTRLTMNDLNTSDHSPQWSPNGQRIAYVSSLADTSRLFVMNADGTDQTPLTDEQTNISTPRWSPDGRRIAFTAGVRGFSTIQVSDADGTNQARLSAEDANAHSPAWSPDGRRVAFVSDRDEGSEVYVVDADGGEPQLLTNDGQYKYGTVWSPDGQRIAYVASYINVSAIFTMNADGSGPSRLTEPRDQDDAPAWSPDSQRIVFTSRRNGVQEVWTMERDGSNQTTLGTTADAFSPQWSADGERIVFTSDRDEDANVDVYTMNRDGSNIVRLTDSEGIEDAPMWMPRE